MVMYAPGGIASLLMMNLRIAAFGKLRELWVSYLALALTALLALVGAAGMVEMVYHLQLGGAQGNSVQFGGVALNATGLDSWFGCAFVVLTGAGLFELCRREFNRQWGQIQEDIEKEIKRRATL
jgi:branched-chain amino acid transport system permease protein